MRNSFFLLYPLFFFLFFFQAVGQSPTNVFSAGDNAVVNEDESVTIDILVNDVPNGGDVQAFTYFLQASIPAPLNGTVNLVSGDTNITYVPNPNFCGTDSFMYLLTQFTPFATSSSMVVVEVGCVNDPPSGVPDNLVIPFGQNGVINVVSNDSDPDLDALNIASVGTSILGTVSFSLGEITLVPDYGACGGNVSLSDTFQYFLTDGLVSEPVDVYVTMFCPNNPPDAVVDNYGGLEDNPILFDPISNDTDPEGDEIFLDDIGAPSNGTLDFIGLDLLYNPTLNFCGLDSVIYTVCDTAGNCVDGTSFFNVSCVNDPPSAVDVFVSVPENGLEVSSEILTTIVDPDGDLVTASIFCSATHGTLSTNAGELYYTPDSFFVGTDSFCYQVCDPFAECTDGMVYITIQDLFFQPTTHTDYVFSTEDHSGVSIDVLANDVDIDGDYLIITPFDSGSHGSIISSPDGQNLEYVPGLNYCGYDTVQYLACDTLPVSSQCAVGTVIIDLSCSNDNPIAVPDEVIIADSTNQLAFDPTLNDNEPDGEAVTLSLLPNPNQTGTAISTGNTIIYYPVPFQPGIDTVFYQICDPLGGCDNSYMAILIQDLPYTPIPENDFLSFTEDDACLQIDLLSNDVDYDGDNINISHGFYGTPNLGSISPLNLNPNLGVFEYCPGINNCGLDTMYYIVCDDGFPIKCDTGYLYIDIDCVNDPPVAQDDSDTIPQNSSLNAIYVLDNDSDADGDLLNIIVLGNPENGTVLSLGDSLLYSPDAGFNGQDTIQYLICDNSNTCDTGMVVLYVRGNLISGSIFVDANSNSAFDFAESGYENFIVEIVGPNGSTFISTDENGFYTIEVDTGAYSVVVNAPENMSFANSTISFYFNDHGNESTENDFPAQPVTSFFQKFVIELTGSYAGSGSTDLIYGITYRNLGSATEDGNVQLVFDQNVTFNYSSPAPSTAVGNTLTWNFTGLAPGESRQILVNSNLFPNLPWATVIHSTATILGTGSTSSSEHDLGLWSQSFSNEKTVEPDRNLSLTEIGNGLVPLVYTVYFQNNGVEIANTVTVEDLLDSATLDIQTLQTVNSSHSFNFSVSGGGLASWEFENINLPTSQSDEIGSMGFVKFQIFPKRDLLVGQFIPNTADVILGNNNPVTTNAVSNLIDTVASPSNLLIPDFSSQLSYCSNEEAVFMDNSSGLIPTLWYWDFGDPSSGIQNNASTNISSHSFSGAGSYDVTLFVSDGNVMESKTQTINVVAFPGPEIVGPGNVDASLGTTTFFTDFSPNNSYSWTIVGGVIGNQSSPAEIVVEWDTVNAAMICVTETNSLGCDSTHCRGIVVIPPPPFEPAFSWEDTVCLSTPVHFFDNTVGANTQWTWDFGDPGSGVQNYAFVSDPVHTFSNSGYFEVTLVTSNGDFSDTLIQQVFVNTVPTPFASGPTHVCPNECGLLYQTGNNTNSFHWEITGGEIITGQGENAIVVCWDDPQTGLISVIETDQNGCHFSSTSNIAVAQTITPSVIQNGTMLNTSMVASEYQWYFNGNPIVGATNISYEMTQFGLYHLMVQDPNGCDVSSDTISYLVGFEDLNNKGLVFSAFPNPFSDRTVIDFQTTMSGHLLVEVYDLLGEKVSTIYDGKINSGDHKFEFDAFSSSISSGVYLVKMEMGSQRGFLKIVKQ